MNELSKNVEAFENREAHAACYVSGYVITKCSSNFVIKFGEFLPNIFGERILSTHDVRATGSIQFWPRNHGAATISDQLLVLLAISDGNESQLRTGLQW